VTWQIRHDAAKPGGAETFGDRQVVFFPPAIAVEQHQRAADFPPFGQFGALFHQLIPQQPGFPGFSRVGRRRDEQTGRPLRAGVRLDVQAVVAGMRQRLPVVVLQGPPGGKKQLPGRPDGGSGEREQEKKDQPEREPAEKFLHGGKGRTMDEIRMRKRRKMRDLRRRLKHGWRNFPEMGVAASRNQR